MKSFKIAAALGLMVAGLGVSTGASAQDYRRDHHGYDRRDYRGDHRGWRGDRHDWRGDRRGYYGPHRGYYGPHRGYGYGNGWGRGGRDCRVTWRHHRRVTVCYR
ncbi:hypothetical protein PX554_03445 [Sphingomonas sp. H39-1-10]|uniref:hypothetical protein n=1 Tax=Sphingomonas pollutisoli TaxID=3030829 RepID=UPI0023B91A9F|nr:hypothetical protein [Sphingomonas pollutisoli]MDF0487173.1 hypothetical protein [Sphingomonas pollutisoli]